MKTYDKYKPSGIPWIGQIPEHWEVRKGRYVYSIDTGSLDANAEDKDGLYPFFTCSMFPKRINTYRFDCEALLVAGNGLVGFTQYYKGKFNAYQRTYVLSDFIGYNPHFLRYYLGRFLRDYAEYNSVGSVISFITLGDMRAFPIPLPPLSEQEAIVSYLDGKTARIDQLLGLYGRQEQLLAELKQTTIAHAVTHGLNPNTPTKPTNIPWLKEIPQHWEVKRIASLFTGKIQVNSEFLYKHAYKFNYGALVLKNETGNEEEYKDTYIKYSILKKGDIVINGLNLNYDFISQRVALCENDGIITSAYVVCRPRPQVYPEYFNYLFKSMDPQKLFHRMGTGIRLTLSFDELKKQSIPLPPLSEQQEIVAYINEKCEKIDRQITSIRRQIELLQEYKQRLIADLVTGHFKPNGEAH